MTVETRNALIENTKALVAADSCCPEAKEAGENLLAVIGTEAERAAVKALLKELKEDVGEIDGSIAFFRSDAAKEAFGEETAAAILKGQLAAKEAGSAYCCCDACQAGGKILDAEADLLA